ncbi:MAG TPA: DNA-binding domain-containing protein [Aestuariivirga sp.]|nr:DNA-binding domain-containing protein [Aestuariivirga sp.]
MQETHFRQAIADASGGVSHPRFGVYRNNVTAALINALRVRYPVVAKLLGEEEFAAITLDFLSAHKPRSPILIDYGDNYPDFLATKGTPYLADVARLENLWWQAYHAADAEPLAAHGFAGLEPENLESARFIFHPSAAILTSRWAIGAIWERARQNTGMDAIDKWESQSVLIWRPQADVRVEVIDDGTAAFLAALMQGKGIADALGKLRHIDLQARLQMLISSRLVTGITQ